MKPPTRVFVDTSFFIALLNSNDNDHQQAVALQAWLAARRVRKVTSEYVLMELGDGLAYLRFRHLASRLVTLVRSDKSFEVIPSSSKLFAKACTLFNQRSDKEWGLTDCSSFVIMQEKKLVHALSADHHFEQAGFHALLLEPLDFLA
jgi:predicted nucleic acid-binding protein